MAAALAWRLGIAGFDESWADPLEGDLAGRTGREKFTGDVDWALNYLAPWVGKGIRGLRHGPASSPSARSDDRPEVPGSRGLVSRCLEFPTDASFVAMCGKRRPDRRIWAAFVALCGETPPPMSPRAAGA